MLPVTAVSGRFADEGAPKTAVSPLQHAAQPVREPVKATFAERLQIGAVTLLDEQGILPAHIISHEHDWQIQVEWTLPDGDKFPQNGRWLVNAFLESIGGGPEYVLAAQEIIKVQIGSSSHPNQQRYMAKLTIIANGSQTVRAGIYRMVVAVTAQDGNKRALHAASFKDGGMLSVY
jgi:hypothetical protein